jgi:hypothetical protein
MEDELKAIREEIAKLRERVAVLEAAKAPISLNQIRQQWAPVPFSDQYAPRTVPPGSPFSVIGSQSSHVNAPPMLGN